MSDKEVLPEKKTSSVLAKRIFFGSLAILAVVLLGALITSGHLRQISASKEKYKQINQVVDELSPSIARTIWQINQESMQVFLNTIISQDEIIWATYNDRFMELSAKSKEVDITNTQICDEMIARNYKGYKVQDYTISEGQLVMCYVNVSSSASSTMIFDMNEMPFLIATIASSIIFVVFSWNLVIAPLRNLANHISQKKPIEKFRRKTFFGLHGEKDEIDILVDELVLRTQALREERAFVEASFPEVIDAIVQTDNNHKVVRYNNALNTILDKEGDLIGLDFVTIFPVSILENQGTRNEVNVMGDRVMEVSTNILQYNGEAEGFLHVIRDMTEVKKLQEESLHSSKLTALGTMSSGIAHDYNNLLATILSNAEFLSSNAVLNQQQSKALNAVIDASYRGSSLSNQLLDFAEKRKPKLEYVNTTQFVESFNDMATSVIQEPIQFNVVMNTDSGIHVDPGALKNALLNLVINARDAIGASGKITLECNAAEQKTQDFIEFRVIDNGMGIAPSDLERIRDPFYTTKPKGKGAGLGLAMVSSFVEQNNGYFNIQSKIGIGTTMTIGLPKEENPDDKIVKFTAPKGYKTQQARVLIIEDEVSLCQVLAIFLESEGYKVESSTSMQDVEEKGYASQYWDLVICDVLLESNSVLEVHALFKGHKNHSPFFLITGNLPENIKTSIHSINPVKIMEKPFRSNDFLHAVKESLHLLKAAE